MRVLIVELNKENPAWSRIVGISDSAFEAQQDANKYAAEHPGVTLGVYVWNSGCSSSTEVRVGPEWEAPMFESPPPEPAQSWTEDVENAELAKIERNEP